MADSPPPHYYNGPDHCETCHDRIFAAWVDAHRAAGLKKHSGQRSVELWQECHRRLVYETLFGQGSLGRSCERALWAAVLVKAIEDLGDRFLATQARSWFESDQKSPGSFIWTCGHLELDPAAVRDRVLRANPTDLRSRLLSANPADQRHRLRNHPIESEESE